VSDESDAVVIAFAAAKELQLFLKKHQVNALFFFKRACSMKIIYLK